MLTQLYIENIAVIEKSNIDFTTGLNVLTGETGAGKSIVIDSINAVMGHRTSKEIIRTGAKSAFVSATFCDINETVKDKLQTLGFSLEDDQLIIQRELSLNGKNNCRINSRPCPVSTLKEIGSNLINIHGQHESYELFSPETHIDYIDSFANNIDLKNEYKTSYKELKRIEKELNSLNTDETNRQNEIDLLSYQINELTAAEISIGEISQLETEKKILQNSEKLRDCLEKIKLFANGDESFSGAIDNIDKIATQIQKGAELNPNLEDLSNRITDVLYNFKDCIDEVDQASYNIDLDNSRLEEVDDRLELLRKLSRKYGQTEEDMLSFLQTATEKLEKLMDFSVSKEELEKSYTQALSKTLSNAKRLSDNRKKHSEQFAKKVKEQLTFLDMPNVELCVNSEKIELTSNGADKIELLVSANPGEIPKPVAKIASGGELSRIMLAIKTVLSATDLIDTLIFDEVDAGISGSAAQKVGLKLKEVSKSRQVLCVTHQAQIAALSDNHLLIRKTVENNKTYTTVMPLDYDGKAHELARIIDGVNITQTALAHAKKLIDSAKEL